MRDEIAVNLGHNGENPVPALHPAANDRRIHDFESHVPAVIFRKKAVELRQRRLILFLKRPDDDLSAILENNLLGYLTGIASSFTPFSEILCEFELVSSVITIACK